MFGQVRHDAVAGADAEPDEPGPRAGDLLAELGEGEVDRPARLRARDDRRSPGVVLLSDQVLGEVQPRAGEPGRAGHLVRGQDGAVRRMRLHLEEVPDR